jgi:S1-C subfamily serine protease
MEENITPGQNTNKPESEQLVSDFRRYLAALCLISALFGFGGGFVAAKYAFRENDKPPSSSTIVVEDSDVVDMVKSASPAVVSVVATKDLSQIPGYGSNPFDDEFFFPFFGTPRQQQQPNIQQVGAGSGFLISSDGLIMTNKHVIDDTSASYTVLTEDGKNYEAKILATDPRNDLALLKIEAQGLPYLELADSGSIQIGQRVVAIGNSLGQYQNTVTTGVVSGIGRSISAGSLQGVEQLEGVIQTDAAINPGNSGGPLLNLAGQVVGINTAMDREGQLVGFAIPSNDAKAAWESYRKNGKISRPFIGVRYTMINKQLVEQQKLKRDYGALVVSGSNRSEPAIVSGSPAEKAGLKEGDIILELDGRKLEGSLTLAGALKNKMPGDSVKLKIFSGGSEKEISLTLEEAK